MTALSAFLAAHAAAALAGVGVLMLLEYLLPRTNSVRARSVLEGVINLLGAALKGVPWLGDVLLRLGSPQVPTLEQVMRASTLQDTTPTKPTKLPPPLALIPLALLFIGSCAGVQPKAVAAHALACALEPVAEHADELANTVTAALLAKSATQQLDGLAVTMGADAVLCAIKSALAAWAGAHAQLSKEAQEGIKRGRAYLAAHGVS